MAVWLTNSDTVGVTGIAGHRRCAKMKPLPLIVVLGQSWKMRKVFHHVFRARRYLAAAPDKDSLDSYCGSIDLPRLMKAGVEAVDDCDLEMEEGLDMEKWRKDIEQILQREENIGDLTEFLIAWAKDVPVPDRDVGIALHAILRKVSRQMPACTAMWIAFYFGAAWHKGLAAE